MAPVSGWRGGRLGAVGGLILLALSGCASPTPYQPSDGSFGFSEQQIEGNRYRVSFAGNSVTPRATVENYLLYRAAELTVQNGYDYFKLADQDTERSTRYYSQGFVDNAFLFPSSRRDRFVSSYGVGLSSATSYPVDEYAAQADILVFKGEKPADDTTAYNARDVLERLGATVVRPAAQG
jgi:hypothetical protein